METIQIKSKIERKDYINLMYRLTYRRPVIILMTIIGIVMLIFSITHFLGLYHSEKPPFFPLVFGTFVVAMLPFSVYRSAIKNYKSHQRLSELITYEFDDEQIRIKGNSFSSELTWAQTYKLLELNHWILIYQNRQVANVISKETFSSEQLIEFRKLIKGLTSLKSKLKE